MANVIYRGPVERETETLNLPAAASTRVGAFVTKAAGKLAIATTGAGRLLLASNLRMMGHDIEHTYLTDETVPAYRLEPELELQALAVQANYADQAELTIGADGLLKAAVATDLVVAYVDGAKNITATDGFIDIVIANSYVKA